MKRLRQLLDVPEEDRGAALILVLFVVTVIGLAGAALLAFSDTSVRTTVALRDQAGNAYNADGAAQIAIDNLATGYGFTSPSLFSNATGTTCFGSYGGTRNLPGFYPAANGRGVNAPSSASVVCAADPATGVNATVVPITGALPNPNRPAQAIMTLGRTTPTGEDGINVKPLSGTPFAVDTVKSNSTIKVVSGSMQSTGAVTAYGACNGTITPSAACNTGTNLDDPWVANPAGYAAEATVVPTYRPVPADVLASCPGGVVTFLPGYYDDAKALTTLMDGTGACAGSTWWFSPGTPADGGRYYFDFHNNTLDSDVYRGAFYASGGANDQWGITSGKLVAGTPIDINGNVIDTPGASPVMPGSCLNPTRSISNEGVQFIFGGDSQLALGGAADAEICGRYSDTKPPIGVYGVRTGTATTTILTGTGTTPTSSLKMSTVVSPGLFTNPTRVIQQDNSSATWVKGATTPPSQSSTITVSGYAPPSAIPAGSIVKSATIRVRHGNSAKYVAADKLAVTFTPKGAGVDPPPGPDITPTFTLAYTSTGLVTNNLVLQQSGSASSDFSKYVHENGFTGADMSLAATLTHAGTESLDAIQIDITYVTPAFRNEKITTITSNCISVKYTGAAGAGCAVLSTSDLTPFTGAFYVQGTTYTPLAPVDLTLSKASQPVLRFGVISRSLWLTQTGSFRYTGPVIGIPDDTTGGIGTPIVILKVYICPAKSTPTCSADVVDLAHPEQGPIEALRVKARINPRPPTISILSWSNPR